ncbi:MAG: alpha-glucan family phosphorylase, partial [Planctomycetes bacterium]|nr:alpha-glucan family phosphorylase [Planctomycetota bacterium]
MKTWTYNVLPNLPERLEALRKIAYNLWFSWDWEAVQLFIRLGEEYWEKSYQNPVRLLGLIPQERYDKILQDNSFLAWMDRVEERFQEYMDSETWFDRTFKQTDGLVAYFSCEYGMDEGLPVYSGGLGILSGDHLKSASDLGIPLCAVGLLYREGYFRQYLNADGYQQEEYPENDWYTMPVNLVTNGNGEPLKIMVNFLEEEVVARIWKVQVGRVSLFLLDTNIPDNPPHQREVTAQLYGGDREMRIRQEILLGIGGLRALWAMGLEPTVCH